MTALIPVNSSAIRAVAYDGYTLVVLFHTSDTGYCHHGVSPEERARRIREIYGLPPEPTVEASPAETQSNPVKPSQTEYDPMQPVQIR